MSSPGFKLQLHLFIGIASASLAGNSVAIEPAITVTELWQWGPATTSYVQQTDVWSSPVSARIYDTNDDGIVNDQDDPSVVFISGDSNETICSNSGASPSACHTGILRILNGRTGEEQYSLDKATIGSVGFAGISVAVGDILGNGTVQIVAVTGEGYVVLIGSNRAPPSMGQMLVLRTSDTPLPNVSNSSFGYGGALALGDMDADNSLEIAYGSSVYATTNDAITLRFTGTGGIGGPSSVSAISAFAELNGSSGLELVAGRTAYSADGSMLWNRSDLPDGYVAVANIDGTGSNEVVLVSGGEVIVLEGHTGSTLLGPKALAGSGSGGPPVLADFDGDGLLEIGVSMATRYSVLNLDIAASTIDELWQTTTQDLGSSVTGSTAFDFDNDGQAEVIEADQCFLWVFDGASGAVRLGLSHTSTTSNEMPITTDIDADGRAELLMVSNGADPKAWGCIDGNLDPVTVNGITWVPSGVGNDAYRGVTAFNAASEEWPEALSLWDQHTFRADSNSFRLGGIGTPVEFCNLNIVSNTTANLTTTYEACEILVLGPDFIAVGDVNISASSGWEIELMPGFQIERGATLEANVCGQSLCEESTVPMPYGCHSCVDKICDVDDYCCETAFDDLCLNMVGTECGLVCKMETYSIDFCRLQHPPFVEATSGSDLDVYGRVWVAGVTDVDQTSNDPTPRLVGYVGYGPDNSSPSDNWTWTTSVPNPNYIADSEPSLDEYKAVLTLPGPGEYDFAFRFSGDNGNTFTYCDLNEGSANGYSPADAGQLTVLP